MSLKKLTVKQNPEKEVPFEVLAEAVKSIGDAMFFLRSSRATERMIVTLVKDHCRVDKGTVERVIHSLNHLEDVYLKPGKR